MASVETISGKGALIIVNGQEKTCPNEEISFEEIVELAFDESERGECIVFTVTFENSAGPAAEGEVGPGECLKVSERVIIHVQRTDQS